MSYRKGEALLLSLLSREQRRSWRTTGAFYEGNWRFDHKGQVLDRSGRRRCVHVDRFSQARRRLPIIDQTTSLLLLLRANPAKFRSVVRNPVPTIQYR